jgi:hypothetical protein
LFCLPNGTTTQWVWSIFIALDLTHDFLLVTTGGLADGSPNWVSFGYTNGQVRRPNTESTLRIALKAHVTV